MAVEDPSGEIALRRISEGVVATVLGGIILWLVTGTTQKPAPTTERMAVAIPPTTSPPAPPVGPSLTIATTSSTPPSAPTIERMAVELPPTIPPTTTAISVPPTASSSGAPACPYNREDGGRGKRSHPAHGRPHQRLARAINDKRSPSVTSRYELVDPRCHDTTGRFRTSAERTDVLPACPHRNRLVIRELLALQSRGRSRLGSGHHDHGGPGSP